MNKFYNIFRKKTILGLIILFVSLSLATMLVSADGEDGSTDETGDPPIDPLDFLIIDWDYFDYFDC